MAAPAGWSLTTDAVTAARVPAMLPITAMPRRPFFVTVECSIVALAPASIEIPVPAFDSTTLSAIVTTAAAATLIPIPWLPMTVVLEIEIVPGPSMRTPSAPKLETVQPSMSRREPCVKRMPTVPGAWPLIVMPFSVTSIPAPLMEMPSVLAVSTDTPA